MSTSATFAAISTTNAAIASQRASDAKAERCKVEVMNFDSKTATIEQQKSYADCIQTLNPEPMSPEVIIALKVWFVLSLLAGVFGGVFGGVSEGPENAIVWFLFAGVAIPCAAGVVAGVLWVLGVI